MHPRSHTLSCIFLLSCRNMHISVAEAIKQSRTHSSRCTHVHICKRMHTHKHTHVYVCKRLRIHTYTRKYTLVSACKHTPCCRDVCETVVEAIEQHRTASTALGPAALAAMAPSVREHALRGELLAAQVLHPALALQDGHYRVGGCMRTCVLVSDATLQQKNLAPCSRRCMFVWSVCFKHGPIRSARPLEQALHSLQQEAPCCRLYASHAARHALCAEARCMAGMLPPALCCMMAPCAPEQGICSSPSRTGARRSSGALCSAAARSTAGAVCAHMQ